MAAVKVGLVGAGPWARMAQLPLLTGGPELELVGVWARRPEAAQEVAQEGGTTACASLEELFDRCDAVAFSVPPEVQADLAVRAAAAGKHLLLDKPVAADVAGAERLADAVESSGVVSMVFFTARFRTDVRALLASAQDARGAQLVNLNGAFLGGPFAESPWRQSEGEILDWGPHAVDLLSAALGPVVHAEARLRDDAVAALLGHEDGGTSQVLFSSRWSGAPVSRVDLVTPAGLQTLDLAAAGVETYFEAFATARRELAEAVTTGTPHPYDVRRGLEVQRVVDALRASARG